MVRPAYVFMRSIAGTRAHVAFFPEATHHEQAVIDRQPEAEHCGDLNHRRVQFHEVREAEQANERRSNRHECHGERHCGGEESAEHDHHDCQGEWDGRQLCSPQVSFGLLGDLLVDQQCPAEAYGIVERSLERLQFSANRIHRCVSLVLFQMGLKVDRDERSVSTLRTKIRQRRVVRGRHPSDGGDAAEALCCGCDCSLHPRVLHAAVNKRNDPRPVWRVLLEHVVSAHRLKLRRDTTGI
jgi:hypothetical protein